MAGGQPQEELTAKNEVGQEQVKGLHHRWKSQPIEADAGQNRNNHQRGKRHSGLFQGMSLTERSHEMEDQP